MQHRYLCVAMGWQLLHVLSLVMVILIQKSFVDAVTLDATPTTLQSSGDEVTLAWRDLESPSMHDWLGIYTPPASADDQYIGYILLSTCATWATGACSLQVPMVNMRAPYNFRLFRGMDTTVSGKHVPKDHEGNHLPDVSQRLAVSSIVGFANYNEPTQVHLALTGNAGEMKVMFVTRDPLKGVVRYGVSKGSLSTKVGTTAITYTQIDMCDSPANSVGWRDPGYIHTALVQGLQPKKRYYYQVGSSEGGWSSIYSFMSSDPHAVETNALLFGDMGTSIPYTTFQYTQRESKNTVKWLQRDLQLIGDKPTFISHIGDISYARGFSWLWDAFFHQIESVAAISPYHVCMGNHEYDWPGQPFKPDWSSYHKDGGGECGVPYSLRFDMPGNSSLDTGTASPATMNLYYSLDVGVVHFLYYCTEIDFLPDSEQYAFIANDLKMVDRAKTPFVVFLGHRPIYTTDSRGMSELMTRHLVQTFEPLLIEHKVSLALCGHVHKYERMCPLQDFKCVEPSSSNGELPIYMVIGMGGAEHQPTDQPLVDHPDALIYPQPEWSIFRTFEWGYLRLHATRHLMTLSYVGNHDGEVHDVLEIPSIHDLRAGTYFEKEQTFFGVTSRRERGQGSWFMQLISLSFAFLVGLGIGVFAYIYLTRRRSWQPVSRDDGVYNI